MKGDSVIWLNRDYRGESAAIDAGDRGFLLADGAFETLYTERGLPAFLDPHLDRLRRGLAALKIAQPSALSEMRAIIAGLAERNRLASEAASVRITVTRGPGPRGFAFPAADEQTPTMLVTMSAASAHSTALLRLVPSSRARYSGAATNGFKLIGGYVENMLAFNEARDAGGDDALMFNEKGRVVSTARANIFAVTDEGAVVTPQLSEGGLPGVVRAALIAGAGEHGVPIEEAPLTSDDLAGAPLFATNSLIGVVPAAVAGSRNAAPSGVLPRLQSWYHERLMREFAKEETGR